MKLYIALFLIGFFYEAYVVLFFHWAHLDLRLAATILTALFYSVNDFVWVKFLKADYDWKGIVIHNVGNALGVFISLTYFPLT